MIYIDKNSQTTLSMQVYEQIRDGILTGALKEAELLTGSRKLAEILGISRNTVDSAYSQLAAEGYISPRRGIGYAVCKVPRLDIRSGTSSAGIPLRQQRPGPAPAKVRYDLTNSCHTLDLFPKQLWRKYTLECLDMMENEQIISPLPDPQGELFLRRQLLGYLQRIRGINVSEEQIIITCGLQQSLDRLCNMKADLFNGVIMEEPGYHKARAVFENNRLAPLPAAVDSDGLQTDSLPDSVSRMLLYTTPSHQFPTGAVLPIGRRYQLLEWARRTGSYIIEDDFDSEQRYYSKPIPALQSIDSGSRVIYLGTFSKSLSPTVRIAYMILPRQLLKEYQRRFRDYNSTVPQLNQYVVGRLIETGNYERHIRRLNNIFRKRYELFMNELSDMDERIKISGSGTGQYFLIAFQTGGSPETLIEKARHEGVQVYSAMQFWQDQAACPPGTLFMGFSKIDLKDIPDCAARLKRAWRTVLL